MINKESQARCLNFATRPDAAWAGNFQYLNAAIARRETFAAGGRITAKIVDGEVVRLRTARSMDDRVREANRRRSISKTERLASLTKQSPDRGLAGRSVRTCASDWHGRGCAHRVFNGRSNGFLDCAICRTRRSGRWPPVVPNCGAGTGGPGRDSEAPDQPPPMPPQRRLPA